MTGTEIALIAAAAMAAASTAVTATSQASAARRNAKVAEQNAAAARRQAEADAERQKRAVDRQLAKRRTAFAAGGVTLEGTPLDLLEDLAMEGELDVLGIRQRGLAEARRFTIAAQNSRAEATTATTLGVLGVGRQLASGGARVAGKVNGLPSTTQTTPKRDDFSVEA